MRAQIFVFYATVHNILSLIQMSGRVVTDFTNIIKRVLQLFFRFFLTVLHTKVLIFFLKSKIVHKS